MYKVLIVEDEILVRVGIKSFIPWEQLGLRLVGEASNGREALEIINTQYPDIILLDIKMPEMDGIELLKMIKERQIKTNVIILSCYDDFVHVREALKLGAVDYVLKSSLKASELANLLEKVRNNLIENSSSSIMEDINALEDEKYPEEYVKEILDSKNSGSNKSESFQLNNFNSNINKTSTVLCGIRLVKEACEKISTIYNIIKEVTKEYKNYYIIMNDTSSILLILTNVKSITDVFEYLNSIMAVIKSYFNISVYMGVSNVFTGINNLPRAYSEYEYAVNYLFYFNNKDIFFYMDTRQFDNNHTIDLKDYFNALYQSIETGDCEKFYSIISSLFDDIISAKNINPNRIKDYVIEIVHLFSKSLELHHLNLQEICASSLYTQILEKNNVYELKLLLIELFEKYSSFINKTKKIKLISKEIFKAQKYIMENYNRDITLSEVAKVINISETYLSLLFKKETGENFVEYLNKIRIEKAKELMVNDDYKAYEVAYLVGYSSISYFTKIFKKLTSLTPSEFKKVFDE